MNLMNGTRTNCAYVLWLNLETRKVFHSLAGRHGTKIGPGSELIAKCDMCEAADAESTNRRTIKSTMR
jgi:hypothetical protein